MNENEYCMRVEPPEVEIRRRLRSIISGGAGVRDAGNGGANVLVQMTVISYTLRYKHAVATILRRPWLGVPLTIWLIGSVLYYYWLVSRISGLEEQNRAFRTQLRLSDKLVRVLAKDSKEISTLQLHVIRDEEGSLCETIHVAIVCMSKCMRLMVPMLKSLLYHRQNPVHFHVIVDAASERTASKLFETWDLPDVQLSCYNPRGRMSLVQWIPNSHYSGVFTLVKLLLPDILPPSVERVIVLDADLTFVSDVRELWDMFRNMTSEQYIGMVENESHWYLDKDRWPALGHGYNTGVVLFHLQRMREHGGWTQLWQDTVRENLVKLKQTMLGDQDIVNAIVKKYPNIVYNISCQYNVQMSTQTFAKTCYGEDFRNVKIIHWNSPSKHEIKLPDADFFRSVRRSYVNLDGGLLRHKLHRCRPEPPALKENKSEACGSFRAAQRARLRTHLYYMDYEYTSADSWDVTLVLQLSTDRLQFLERLVNYWEGPLSAAIYLTDHEVGVFESFISDWSDTLSSRRNIGYHLVFKQDTMHYPVNYLRNVALQNVNTPYVFLMDADFVPMRGLYDHLRNALQLINPAPQKKVLVVAAFESQRYRVQPPRDKAALLARLGSRGDVAPFRAREWPSGHRATNYTRWVNATVPYEVEWATDYEPYLVAHRSLPAYDERFAGFGWNKVSHGVELRATGHRAVVLPGAFVVHAPHAPSHDITMFRRSRHYRLCLALLKQEFMEDLRRKYNITLDEPPAKEEHDDNG